MNTYFVVFKSEQPLCHMEVKADSFMADGPAVYFLRDAERIALVPLTDVLSVRLAEPQATQSTPDPLRRLA